MKAYSIIPKYKKAVCLFLLLSSQFSIVLAQNPIIFGPEYLQGEKNISTLNELWNKTKTIRIDYKQNLDDASPFNGLYARGEGWQSLESGAYEYKYGIDLELYENGRYEARRRINKSKLESEVQNLQLLNNMKVQSADESLHVLRLIKDRVKREYAHLYNKLVKYQLIIARKEFNNGLLSQNDFSEYVSRNIETNILIESFSQHSAFAIPETWFHLLNNAEHLKLIDKASLLKLINQRSYSLKLQTLFQQRALFHETWRDDLSLRLYLEKRYSDYNHRHDTVAGFRLKVPLDKPGHRNNMIELEEEVYQIQIEAIQLRYKQRINDYHSFFNTQKNILLKMQNKHEFLLKEISANKEHYRLVLPNLPYTPEKDNRVSLRDRTQLEKEILLQRLKVIEILFSLNNLTQSPQPEDILQTLYTDIISIKLDQ